MGTGTRHDAGRVDLEKLATKADMTAVAAEFVRRHGRDGDPAHLAPGRRDGRRGCDPARDLLRELIAYRV